MPREVEAPATFHSYERPETGETVEFRAVADGRHESVIVLIDGYPTSKHGPFRTRTIAAAWARGWQARDTPIKEG